MHLVDQQALQLHIWSLIVLFMIAIIYFMVSILMVAGRTDVEFIQGHPKLIRGSIRNTEFICIAIGPREHRMHNLLQILEMAHKNLTEY